MSHAKQRLAVAKENLAKLFKQLEAIGKQQQKITENAQAALDLIQLPATERRAEQLKSFLTAGKPDKATVARMRDDAAEHAVINAQRQEIESARQAAIDELNDQGRALGPELNVAKRVIAEAIVEAAREDIEVTLVPEFLEASERFKQAFARLAAAGAAHADFVEEARNQHGISGQSLGWTFPIRIIDVPAPVTSVMRPDTGKVFRIDASVMIDKYRAEFKESWK